jgi:hypothetical protein
VLRRCGAALIAGLSGIDAAALHEAFDDRAPRRGVTAFLLIMAAALCLLWLSQIAPFYLRGELPAMVIKAKASTVFVYVLDLGVVVPLALLAAFWLARGRPWGSVLAGFVLINRARRTLPRRGLRGTRNPAAQLPAGVRAGAGEAAPRGPAGSGAASPHAGKGHLRRRQPGSDTRTPGELHAADHGHGARLRP